MFETEGIRCWIRGSMNPRDYQDDPVRLATINCPFRKGKLRTSLMGTNMDYDCTNPAALGEYDGSAKEIAGGGIMVGGVDDFATFCVPIDMHLTSLGERPRLIIDGKFTVVDNKRSLPPASR